jgi:hypothetical protein
MTMPVATKAIDDQITDPLLRNILRGAAAMNKVSLSDIRFVHLQYDTYRIIVLNEALGTCTELSATLSEEYKSLLLATCGPGLENPNDLVACVARAMFGVMFDDAEMLAKEAVDDKYCGVSPDEQLFRA